MGETSVSISHNKGCIEAGQKVHQVQEIHQAVEHGEIFVDWNICQEQILCRGILSWKEKSLQSIFHNKWSFPRHCPSEKLVLGIEKGKTGQGKIDSLNEGKHDTICISELPQRWISCEGGEVHGCSLKHVWQHESMTCVKATVYLSVNSGNKISCNQYRHFYIGICSLMGSCHLAGNSNHPNHGFYKTWIHDLNHPLPFCIVRWRSYLWSPLLCWHLKWKKTNMTDLKSSGE